MVGALPLVVWPLELAANDARPGFRAQPGKLPPVFNHRSVYILTAQPLTGHRHQERTQARFCVIKTHNRKTTLVETTIHLGPRYI